MAEAALRGLGSRQRSRRLFAAGMILVGGLGLVAAAAPWLTSYDPDAIVVAHYAGPLPPGGAHPLGTDTLGRDVWARLAYGARTSLFVGGLAMTLSLGIGVTVCPVSSCSPPSACPEPSASTPASPTLAWGCRCRRRRGAAW